MINDFCWVELTTTDQTAAKAFYAALFEWTTHDLPTALGENYTVFQLDGRDVAAAGTLGSMERAMGIPPSWTVYVAVESADESARHAERLGGTIVAMPFDVTDHGRMAIIRDPTGAVVALWQSTNGNNDSQITGIDGTVCWADLSTPSRQHAADFYGELFGWEILAEDEEPAHQYFHIKNRDTFIGGMPPIMSRHPNAPAHWQVYFQVADCDAATATAARLGATIRMPPMTIEDVGRIAVLADPQGATFALYGP